MDSSLGFGGVKAEADDRQLPQRLVVPFQQAYPPTPIDPSKAPPKTPISLLQEACIRLKITPLYELISTEGQVHEPVFTYRCAVDGIIGQGSGKSKKTAKHLAALGILDEIVRRGKGGEWGIPGNSVAASIAYLTSLMPDKTEKTQLGEDAEDESKEGNPVGKLQERCSQLKLPTPEYELEEEVGAAHQKFFKVVVRLGKLQARSEAKTKKAAKRLAAELMLTQIANLTSNQGFDEDDLVEEESEPGAAYPAELEAQLSELRTGPLVVEMEPTEEKRSSRGLEELLNADLSLEKPNAETLAWLRRVARTADDPSDPVSFRKLDNLSVTGQVQCLVQLSTMPVAVCHGTGATETDAQYDAAKNALQYLRIMAKSSN